MTIFKVWPTKILHDLEIKVISICLHIMQALGMQLHEKYYLNYKYCLWENKNLDVTYTKTQIFKLKTCFPWMTFISTSRSLKFASETCRLFQRNLITSFMLILNIFSEKTKSWNLIQWKADFPSIKLFLLGDLDLNIS